MPGATTDTRIVQMQFDNRNFERNIQVSEKSLQKFKDNLDFSKHEKSLAAFERATRGLSFDTLANNIQKLTDKFTGLGTISELILSQIRRGIEQTAQKVSGLINSLGFEQVSAGLEKYKDLNKSVQTIMAATGREEGEVYKVLERLNAYTDMTSYNFTDMAQNIGKFTSVGIKLEDAEKQMEGIANWAARSGAGINEASRAMYNLSQAMGVGKMTLIDWKSIENAGMATKEFKEQMLAASVAAGTLTAETDKSGKTVYKTAKQFGKQMEVNYQNMSTTLSKGWATSDVIQQTLMQYYNENLKEGEEASAKAVELTKEQLEKTKALFSDNSVNVKEWKTLETMGLATDEVKQAAIDAAIAQGNLVKETTKDGKTIYKTAEKYGKQIEVTMDNIEQSLKVGWLDKSVGKQIGLMDDLAKASYEAAQKCTNLTDVLQAWRDQLSTGWMKSWQLIFGNLTESMDVFSAICNKVGDAFTTMMGNLTGYDEEGEHITGILEAWAEQGGRENLWSMFIGEYDGLYEGAYGMLDVLHDIGDMISGAFWDIMSIFVGEDRRGIFKTDPKARNAWIGIQLNNITESVKNFIGSIRDFFNKVPEGETQSRFESLQNIVKGIFSIFAMGGMVVKDLIEFFSSVGAQLTASFDAILNLFSYLGLDLKNAAQSMNEKDGFKQTLNDILEIIRPLTTAFNSFIGALANLIRTFNETDKANGRYASILSSIANSIKNLFSVITRIGTPIFNFLATLINAFGDLYKNGFNAESIAAFATMFKEAFKTMLDSLFSFIPNFSSTIKGIWDAIKNLFTSGFSTESFENLKGKLKDIFESIKKVIPPGVKNIAKTIIGAISGAAKTVWDKISGLFDSVKKVFESGFSEESVKELKDKFQNFFSGIWDKVPEGLKTGAKNILGKVSSGFTEIWTKITAVFEKVKNVFANRFSPESVKSLKDVITNTFKSVTESVPEAIKEGGATALEKIKNFFTTLWTGIKGLFQRIFSKKAAIASGSGNTTISTVVSNIVGDESTVGKAIDTVKNLTGKVSTISESVQFVIGTIKSVFTKGKNTLTFAESFMDVLKKITDFLGIHTLSDLLLAIVGILGIVGIVKTVKVIRKTIDSIVGGIKTISDTIKKGLNLDTSDEVESFGDKMLKLSFAIAIMVAAIHVLGQMEAGKAWNGVGIIVALMAAMFVFMKALRTAFKASQAKKINAAVKSMLAIAISTWILVKALLPLSQINWDQFKQMFIGLAAIFAYLFAMGKLAKSGNFNISDMKGVLALCAGIAIMIFGLKQIQDARPDQLLKMGVALVSILGILFAFSLAVSKFSSGIAGSGMKELGFVALSVGILVLSLLPLAIIPWPALAKMGVGLFAVLAMLVGFIWAVNKANISGKGLVQLIAVAGTVMMLVLALLPLCLIPVVLLIKGLAALGVMMLMLRGFIKAADGISLSKKAMAQLLAVAGTVILLVLALIPLALIEPWNLAKALIGLGIIMMLLIGFINEVNSNSISSKGMVSLLAVAGTVILLVLALIPLALADWEDLGKMGAGLVCIVIALLAITHMLKNSSDLKKASGGLLAMVALAGLMVVFGAVLEKVKDVNWGTILAFAGGLGLMVLLIAVALDKMKNIAGNPKTMFIAIAGITAAVTLMLGVLALMLPVLMGTVGSALQTLSARLSLAAGMFADFIKQMNGISLASIFEAKAKIEAFFDMLGVVKDSANYVEGLHSFGECMSLLGFAVHQFQMSTEGLNEHSFDAAIKLITVGIIPLGPLLKNYIVGNVAQEFLKLGTAISLFYRSTQGIVYSDPNPAISMAKQILALKNSFAGFSVGNAPTEIFTLGVGLMLFNDAASSITTDEPVAFKLLKNLADQADNLDKLTKLPLEDFKQHLSGLGGALSIYAEGVASATGLEIGDGTPDVSGALRVLHALTDELAKDSTKLVLPDIPDKTELDGFGADLAALATALKKFTDVSKEMDWVSTAMALNTLDFMEALQGKLTDDAVARFNVFKNTGVNVMSLAMFGLDIAALGVSLKNYNDSVKDFKENQAALDVLDFMFKLQWKLAWIDLATAKVFDNAGVHETTLASFGTDIAALGNAMWQYSVAVESFKDNQNVMKALDYFAGLKDKLNTDSLKAIEEFVAYGIKPETLTSFGTDIGTLGENLAGFAQNVNFDPEKAGNFDNAIAALEKLRDISNRLPMVGGIVQIWEGHRQTLSDVATHIKVIGEAFAQMTTDLSGDAGNGIKSFNVDLVSSAFDMLNKLADIAVTFASRGWSGETNAVNDATTYVGALQMMMENITKGFMNNPDQNLVKGIVTFMQQFREASAAVGGFGEKDISMFEALRNMVESLNLLMKTDTSYDFSKLGENMSNGIKDGIVSMSETMNETMKQQIKDLRTAANNEVPLGYPLTFADIGYNIAVGLRDGIAQGHDEVVQKVIDMVTAARDAAQKTADENSPSKVFQQIGAYISQGLALGIREDTKDPVNASKDMVKNIIDSTDGALSNLSWLLANGVDTNPTITPVLDLSNVQKGMSDLNGQFGNRKMGLDVSGVAARAGVSAWNLSAHPETIQNGTNLTGVYERMTTLGNQIVEMGNQIQKMRVVLDTGALVGGVTDGVDANIGRKTFYATRRN